MSDILEVNIIENPFEIAFNDPLLEVFIEEDNFEVSVSQDEAQIILNEEGISILTIAEQGPPGVGGGGSGGLFPIIVSQDPPVNAPIGTLWLDI